MSWKAVRSDRLASFNASGVRRIAPVSGAIRRPCSSYRAVVTAPPSPPAATGAAKRTPLSTDASSTNVDDMPLTSVDLANAALPEAL